MAPFLPRHPGRSHPCAVGVAGGYGRCMTQSYKENAVANHLAIDNAEPGSAEARLAKALVGFKLRDNAFHLLTLAAAWAVLILLGGVIAALVVGSVPAIRAFGLNFLTTEAWNPVTEKFGAMAAVYGTIVTSLIAMAIAVPVGLGIAIFLTELCPYALRRPIGIAIELLAGIPSIIYGIWGLFVLAPFLQEHVQPGLISAFANVPVLSELFAGPPYGIGVLTAGVILAIMVLPIVSFDLPRCLRNGSRRPEGSRLWRRLHDLGSGSIGRDPLHPRGHYRRRHAGPRPGARRDHGGDFRDRQRA